MMTSFREKRLKCLEMKRLADSIVFVLITLVVLTLAFLFRSDKLKNESSNAGTEKETIYFQ